MIPEIRVHNGKLIVCEVRRENLVTIEGLCPSITNGRGRGETLRSSITTGSWGGNKQVGGRHLRGNNKVGGQ